MHVRNVQMKIAEIVEHYVITNTLFPIYSLVL
jgi:hypothetical protein